MQRYFEIAQLFKSQSLFCFAGLDWEARDPPAFQAILDSNPTERLSIPFQWLWNKTAL